MFSRSRARLNRASVSSSLLDLFPTDRTTSCSGTTYYREFPNKIKRFHFDRPRHEEDITLKNRVVDENRWRSLRRKWVIE